MDQGRHIVTMQIAQSNPDAMVIDPLCFKHNMIDEDYELHTHDCYELELVVQGKGTHWLNGTKIPLSPGSFFLLSPEDFHRFETDGPLRFLTVKISDNLLPDTIKQLLAKANGGVYMQCRPAIFSEVRGYYEQIELEFRNSEAYHVQRIYAWLTLLITKLLGMGQKASARPVAQDVMPYTLHAIEYINKCLNEPISLAQIASRCCLSPCYFSSIFTKQVGHSFTKYLADKRVQQACQMLRSTNQSISQIAYACGFGSMSNFQRAFKSKVKMPPSAYRKMKEAS